VRIARFSTATSGPTFGVLERDTVATLAGHPFGELRFTGERLDLAAVRLLAPIVPSKIVAVGKNYREHAAEMGGETPAAPLLFLKPSTSVIGPGDPIQYPPSSSRVDFEGELAVVMGRLCRDVPESAALAHVLGYTCANDVTARDQQASDGQWTRAKGYDSFCPLGPWLETELDPRAVTVSTSVGGQQRQHGSAADLVFDVAHLISYISRVMTLLPTDVILTGTPAGVGPLQVGDEVSVTVSGIGSLTNRVIARG